MHLRGRAGCHRSLSPVTGDKGNPGVGAGATVQRVVRARAGGGVHSGERPGVDSGPEEGAQREGGWAHGVALQGHP